MAKPVDYQSQLLLMGSCFAENMGERCHYFKFQTMVNPFGIIFNPVSLHKLIDRAVQLQYFTVDDIFCHNNLWHCFEVHSQLSTSNPDKLLESLNKTLLQLHEQLQKATHIMLTLGTAWVYRRQETNAVVANCHKVPQREFVKQLLQIEVVEQHLDAIRQMIKKINPDITLVITVSPVRHSKDGFVENNRSKAHLLAALHRVVDHYSDTYYFPSYEIVMDELRDYRFYTQDMLHPNAIAIDYIWKRFKETCVATSCYNTMKEVDDLQKALSHRSFNPESPSHLQFLVQVRQRIEVLQEQYPFMTF